MSDVADAADRLVDAWANLYVTEGTPGDRHLARFILAEAAL